MPERKHYWYRFLHVVKEMAKTLVFPIVFLGKKRENRGIYGSDLRIIAVYFLYTPPCNPHL
jgi:hypothetical protein